MSGVTFGKMRIEFTASEPGSVIMTVRARVSTKAELDKLVAAVSASRDLLRDSDGPRMAETNEDSARGEAGPARAAESGIAQPLPGTQS